MTTSSQLSISQASRRGSAILIVVGTLALIAVFAAIYISIGHSDQRVARSVQSHEEIVEIQNAFAEHILGVLGDDRLNTTTQHIDTGSSIFTVREVTDAPYTDWTMRSESNNSYELYNPSGGHTEVGNAAAFDYRVASDPYLASTSPTYLGDPGQQNTSLTDLRPFGSLIHGNAAGANEDSYIGGFYSSDFLDKRDWQQISNLAPDGRFVNLFNLRPNPAFGNNGVIGGFDAESGSGTFIRPSDSKTIRRMSQYLSLWKPRLGTGVSPVQSTEIQAFDPEIEGIWLPGRNEPEINHGIVGELANVPAVWTMYQRFMFHPINQPFITVNRNNQMSTWADPDYSVYQYTDADGDGMADSRWFELTATRNTQSGSTTPRTDTERLYDAGKYRLFAAARVADLSSMVNVNTASDQLEKPEPNLNAPLGVTPGEVDLRRLLTMQDGATNLSIAPFVGLSPSYFHRPRDSTLDDPNDEDFWHYRAYIDQSATPKEILPSTMSLSAGRFAYTAIKRGQYEGTILDERYYAWPPEMDTDSGTINWAAMNFDDNFNPPSGDYSDPTAAVNPYRLEQGSASTSAENRKTQYNRFGRLNPFEPSVDGLANQRFNGLYNEDDLLELLAFHGLNDPSTLSRLEKAAMGRVPSIFDRNQRSFSPLFSSRPLSLDRDRHGYVDNAGYEGHYLIHDLFPNFEREISGGIAKESMAFFALSPRRLMTTVSGGAGLVPGLLINSADPQLLDAEAAPTLQGALGSVSTLFDIYTKSLAGELDIAKLPLQMNDLFVVDRSAVRSDVNAGPLATLFYGHKGPELALRIAAHAAVNMKDLADFDTETSVATLLIDNGRRDEFDATHFPTNLDPDDEWYRDYAGVAMGNTLDVGATKLPGTEGGAEQFVGVEEYRQAVNVYGIEAMPVITEFVSFYVFHDAPEALDGDTDFSPLRPRVSPGGSVPPGVIPFPGAQTKITINNDIDPSDIANPDSMMHGIAVQLHNPFSSPISLGGDGLSDDEAMMRQRDPNNTSQIDTNSNFAFDYYIEWHGYFFKLAEYQQYYPPLASPFELRTLDNPAEDLGVPNPAAVFPIDGSALDPATYADYVARNVVLQPGETRVFYAMADPRFNVVEEQMELDFKWTRAMNAYNNLPLNFSDLTNFDADGDGLADGLDSRGWTGPARDWIRRQFIGTGSNPVMMHPMNPRTGVYHDTTFKDYINTAGSELAGAFGRDDDAEVRLWRKIVAPAEETTDTSGDLADSFPENLLHNDMLGDRMRTLNLAEKINGGEVAKTASFPEIYPEFQQEADTNVRNDNTGFTVVKWAVASRRDRDILDVTTPGLGQVREWMMSSRLDPDSSLIDAADTIMSLDGDNVLSAGDFIDDGGGDLDNVLEPRTMITNGDADILDDYETHRSLKDLFFTSGSVFGSMNEEPEYKNNILPDTNGVGTATKFGRDATGPSRWLHPDGITLHEFGDTTRTNLRPDLFLSGEGILPAPRLADLLLPWGIGPTFAPTDTGSLDPSENTLSPGYYPEEWMTLPEAVAIALGFENPSLGNKAADSIWNDAFTTSERLLDNGHLVLDNYVAFYNVDTSENVPDFDPPVAFSPNLVDIRRGSGIPMALGVLDQTRAILPIDNTLTNEELLGTPTYGLVNINTAPVEVLRLLPGLSPSLARYYPQNTNVAKESEWWPIDTGGLELPDLSTELTTPDVAATMVGYRDRGYVQPRNRSTDSLNQGSQPLNYTAATNNASSHARNLMTEVPELNPILGTDHRHRQMLSGIDGLRSTPGFGSVGEVLAVTLGESALGLVGVPHINNFSQLDIQQYGTDTLNLDGISDTLTAFDPQLFGGDTNGETVDDYAERLAMANGILNTISVRSDYFAVWFVVHAYQESDVSNLTPEDPLVPSIAKRYVMVVDRTNVKDPGDTPKIVFLREVPM